MAGVVPDRVRGSGRKEGRGRSSMGNGGGGPDLLRFGSHDQVSAGPQGPFIMVRMGNENQRKFMRGKKNHVIKRHMILS